MHFMDNLLLLPTMKEFSKSVVDKVIVKSSTARFFLRHSGYMTKIRFE